MCQESVELHWSIPVSKIINLSIEHCTFPEKDENSYGNSCIQNENIFECNNYQPTSLLPNQSKIFEKLVQTRLSKFLESNKCLFPKQFGFRNKYSTTHALIDITDTIRKAIDNGEFACGVFLDLQKAFDTVNHTILLKNLNTMELEVMHLNGFILISQIESSLLE